MHILVLILLLTVIFSASFAVAIGECDSYLSNLTDIASSTYACLGKFTRPLSVCGQCLSNVTALDGILNNTEAKNQFGVPCKYFVEEEALIQPWNQIISSIKIYWENAHCGKCLAGSLFDQGHFLSIDRANEDILPNYNLAAYNNSTLEFFYQLKATVECISQYVLNSNTTLLDPVTFPTEGSIQLNNSVCQDCQLEYIKLFRSYRFWVLETSDASQNSWYILPETITLYYQGLCIDVVDALNRTQFVWTKILGCSSPTVAKPLGALLPLFVFAVAGVLFHSALICIFHKPSHVIVYMQSRVTLNSNLTESRSLNENTDAETAYRSSTLLRKTSFAPVARNISFDVLPPDSPIITKD